MLQEVNFWRRILICYFSNRLRYVYRTNRDTIQEEGQINQCKNVVLDGECLHHKLIGIKVNFDRYILTTC